MDDSWNKKLLAFLNGLARRKYFGEDISDELLKEQVLGEADEEGDIEWLAVTLWLFLKCVKCNVSVPASPDDGVYIGNMYIIL